MAGYRRKRTRVIAASGEESTIIAPADMKLPSGDVKLTVGEVAKLTGVPASKLRHYDDIGLLCPKRSGEDVANNRKLYDADDLERLQAILTLSAYQFNLKEIKQVLDGELDLHALMVSKLDELKRRETRLRNLIRFARFVELADEDLIEGLACGPIEIDELADLARMTPLYPETIQKLEGLNAEEAARTLAELDTVIERFTTLEELEGFAGIEEVIAEFFNWWNAHVYPFGEIGCLGFWAIFEDHGLIAEYFEEIGSAGDAGFLQMSVFYVSMKRLVEQAGGVIVEVSRLANEDIVAALEEANELIDAVAIEMLGESAVETFELDALADLAFVIMSYLCELLQDEGLQCYLELGSGLAFEFEDALIAMKVIDLFGTGE